MILIIDNYDSFVHNLYQEVAQLIHPVKVVRNNKITLDEIEQLKPSGIILSPGPGRPENAGICVPLIKKFSGVIPILGVCLGHQALAVAFGGEVISAGAIVHGKPENIFHYRQNLYQKMPLPFSAARYHSLMVSAKTLPDDFIIEAETTTGLIMGMKHKLHNTFGVQFHPESILTPDGKIFLQEFVQLCQGAKNAE